LIFVNKKFDTLLPAKKQDFVIQQGKGTRRPGGAINFHSKENSLV